jgi:1-aminocyclopropane-1-carboxylate deaminase/D-cysteine desulfhydrase-like pyridoxal-dependent ACC family enzyme
MLAIACITNHHKCKFTYYTKKVNNLILNKGNYDLAIKYGMNHIELSNSEYDNLHELSNSNDNNNTLWIPQGGAYNGAKHGVYKLTEEIVEFIKQQKEMNKTITKWKIIFASGTGTTALFAAQSLNKIIKDNNDYNIEMIALPCVGSKEYLMEQMNTLDSISEGKKIFPTILSDDQKRIFAKPYKEHYSIWSELYQQTNILFDLIYFPRSFEIFLYNEEYWNDDNTQIIWYHCGGCEGNESQLNRYKHSKIL